MSGPTGHGGSPVPLVLVVEDSAGHLLQLQKLFRTQGMSVITAVDGISGLQAAYQQLPDAIVASTAMPVLSGLTLCWLLKADPAMAGIPVILLREDADGQAPHWQAYAHADHILDTHENPTGLAQTVWAEIKQRGYPGLRLRSGNAPIDRSDRAIEDLLVGRIVYSQIADLAPLVSAGNRHQLARGMFDLLASVIDYRAAGVFFLQPDYATFFLNTLQSLPSDQLNALLTHAVVPLRGVLRGSIRLELFAGAEQTPRELGRWTPATTSVPPNMPVVAVPLQSGGLILGSLGLIATHPADPRNAVILADFAEHFAVRLQALYLFEEGAQGRRDAEKARSAAQTQQRMLTQVSEQMADGLFLVDAADRVVSWNAAAARITGCAAQSVLNRQFLRTEHASEYDRALSLDTDPIRCGWPSGKATAEYVLRSPTGRAVPVSMTFGTVHDASGQALLSVYTFQDLQAGCEVARLREGIAAIVSEELEEPVATMREGLTGLLHGHFGPLEPRQRTALEMALRGGEQLVTVGGDLLALAHGAESSPRLRLRPTDLVNLIRAVVGSLRPLLEGQRMRIELRVTANVPMLRLDGPQLAQALTTLLTAAGRLTEPGSLFSLRVAVEGRQVQIAMQDTGIAIETATELCNGLDLAASRAIVAAHGGNLSVQGVAGQGSIFTVQLPMPAVRQPVARQDAGEGAA